MTKKKKVLIFIDWYLPGYRAGGPIQSCANLIEHLKDEFDFSVVTRNTDYMCKDPYANVKSNEWNLLLNNTRVYYFSSDNLSKKNIEQLLVNEEYDDVYLNGIYSRYFTLYPLRYLKHSGKRIVIAARGMLSESALSVKSVKKKIFLASVKILKLFDAAVFHATNEQEERDIKKVFGTNAKINIAPNLPPANNFTEWKGRRKKAGEVNLVSIARIAPEKNTKYALEILQRVKTNVVFDIYGTVYNKQYWNECKKVIKHLPANVKVGYKGSLESAKVQKTLRQHHFLFMPTRGENFGHVILQSLNGSVPVIISDKTMWSDLQNKNAGWTLPLDFPEKYVQVIENCSAMSQPEYDELSKGAFDFAHAFISNDKMIEQSKQLFLK